MSIIRHATALFLLGYFCQTQFSAAQRKPGEGAGKQSAETAKSLKMTVIGNGKLSNGHSMAFRIYEAPDGAKGEVTYATLPSVQDAQRQIEEWVRLAKRVRSREHDKKNNAKLISDRIVGWRLLTPREPTKTRKKATEFLIIRRDGMNCYFVESLSFEMATKVEDLTD